MLLYPYSLVSIVAVIKAVAVWPEGNERRLEPSGRSTCSPSLIPLVTAAMMATEKASDTSMRPHDDRLRTPAAFRPTITTAGEYCR